MLFYTDVLFYFITKLCNKTYFLCSESLMKFGGQVIVLQR